MKIKNQVYAEGLIESVESDKADLKKIARKFWLLLQKNKQYPELERILETVENELALREDRIIFKVYSEKPLLDSEKKEIIDRGNKITGKEIIIKNIINKSCSDGIKIKSKDEFIDLTISSQINRLKQIIAK